MACLYPLLAVDYGATYHGTKSHTFDGKHKIKVFPPTEEYNFEVMREKYGNALMMLPCGHCVACAQDYARTWQARIMCEAMYHKKKCFLTLTYAKNPPKEPQKEHLRDFIKAVRNKYGDGIKFFGCGEKGELSERAHYHIILFGVDFNDDAETIQRRGTNLLQKSATLRSLWPYGFSSIGSLDIASAGYVSKYCDKKKISQLDNGEFVIMSRGLGRQYFLDHYKEIFTSDYLYFDGNKFKIPRYFKKLALNKDDFYLTCLVDDYSDRKRLTAINFRYNHNRSIGSEANALQEINSIKLSEKKNKEVARDVA